jgi:hypothetical protein
MLAVKRDGYSWPELLFISFVFFFFFFFNLLWFWSGLLVALGRERIEER